MSDAARRKAFTLARELGMDRDERIEFARMLVADETIESWNSLSDEQFRRLLDGMEGFLLVTHLLNERTGR